MNYKKSIAEKLLQIKAIQIRSQNPFTWASGKRSPIYCDNRLTLSYPDIRKLIRDGFVEMCSSYEHIDGIVGVATAGIPHGMLLADALDVPFAYVRSSAKAHGKQNKIEGHMAEGSKVIVVEDLFSTGGSSIEAAASVRDIGLDVLAIFAIFTYGFDEATANFEKAGFNYATLSNYDALLDSAIALNYIEADQKETLTSWRQDPDQWSQQFSQEN